jgi:hypothetical protein
MKQSFDSTALRARASALLEKSVPNPALNNLLLSITTGKVPCSGCKTETGVDIGVVNVLCSKCLQTLVTGAEKGAVSVTTKSVESTGKQANQLTPLKTDYGFPAHMKRVNRT